MGYSQSTDGSASLHESVHSSTAADRNLADIYIVRKPATRASKWGYHGGNPFHGSGDIIKWVLVARNPVDKTKERSVLMRSRIMQNEEDLGKMDSIQPIAFQTGV